MVETRWDDIRRRLNEGNCWPSGSVFELLDELEAEAKSLRDDAALGALVRQMPPFSRLVCAGTRNVWRYEGPGLYPINWSDTPEAALREALGEEQDG